MSILSETKVILWFIIDGLIIGLLFDLFRILRRSIKTSNFITQIEDAFFGIISALIIIVSTVYLNNGIIRLYLIFSITIGLILYFSTISKFIVKISTSVLTTIIKLLSKTLSFILFPFRCIKNILQLVTYKFKIFVIKLFKIKGFRRKK